MKLFYEKYIKLAHIGKGANAHVYKVRHAELGYVRAIKILNEDSESKGELAYQSFLKECKTLLAIGNGAHPNIIRIYGPDLIDNHAIVEMDYVQGTTLDSYIKNKGFLDYEEVKIFIHDIVGALAYTHHDIYKFLMNPEEDDLQLDPNDGHKYVITPQKEAELVKKYGIAHNDLHSNNVMRRDYDGSFVLLDFGLAVQDGECIKSSRKSDGHPEYMAPEKFDSGDITSRSDVYSLGVLIYEALTGRPPFILVYDAEGKVSYPALSKICNEHHNQTPPEILSLRKSAFERHIPGAVYERDYPEWLDDVVMKCLAKNPQDRYSDAKELLDDIEIHIAHEVQKNADNTLSIDSIAPDMDSDNPPDTENKVGINDSKCVGSPPKSKHKRIFGLIILLLVFLPICMIPTLRFYELDNKKNKSISVTDIMLPDTIYHLNVGDTIEIIPCIIPDNATDSVILKSSNEEIATVKGNSLVALKGGKIVVWAETKDSVHFSRSIPVHISVSRIRYDSEPKQSDNIKRTSIHNKEWKVDEKYGDDGIGKPDDRIFKPVEDKFGSPKDSDPSEVNTERMGEHTTKKTKKPKIINVEVEIERTYTIEEVNGNLKKEIKKEHKSKGYSFKDTFANYKNYPSKI